MSNLSERTNDRLSFRLALSSCGSAFVRCDSNRLQELDQQRLLVWCEFEVAVLGDFRFSVVSLDGILNFCGTSIMQVRATGTQAPEGWGFHVSRTGRSLDDAVAERAHVMQQQVGVEQDGLGIERRNFAGTGGQHGRVAARATDIQEQLGTERVGRRDRLSRGRAEEPHKVGETINVGLAIGRVHLVLGIAGLPVFAASPLLPQGALRLLGPTGGYLMSYPFAAFIAGMLAERGFDRRYLTSVVAMAAGLMVVFTFGVLWLAWFARPVAGGLDVALRTGLYPFLPADIFKLFLAAAVMPGLWKLTGKDTPRIR